jgi:hypothetical protein
LEGLGFVISSLEVLLINFINTEVGLIQDGVVSLVEINLVSKVLIELVNFLKGVDLLNEIFNGINGLLKRSGRVFDPSTS